MSRSGEVRVTLPADVNQVDDTGRVWTLLEDASKPERVVPGAVVVAGDSVEPFLAQVVDVLVGRSGTIVHLDVMGSPEDMIDELRHVGLLPT